ncbi:MAG: hypothetical protein A3H70_03570 [Candidatus Komeilibacteria bacterium RIFCSPLOWO2_02_FULL_48_11]|uniref:Uncharacterized protein n=1 Tax=Candidatus Komeilibacteria bacterium RIFCSPLOWO2_02_FULL_48_11 TaxID=1798553 RepID=A0A1G2BVG6_9BACT|nr:MAG: hypothetical protein A3H70_03570 [Candidatus Komeilibacteria bacterium RIFCSPLOWO2_02_FULL_48_11]
MFLVWLYFFCLASKDGFPGQNRIFSNLLIHRFLLLLLLRRLHNVKKPEKQLKENPETGYAAVKMILAPARHSFSGGGM